MDDLDYNAIDKLIGQAMNLGLYLDQINGEVVICTSMTIDENENFVPYDED